MASQNRAPDKLERIFLDNAATTPLAPTVRAAMLPWLDAGNASSLYLEGRKSRMAIDEAREVIAESIDCLPGEITFTSSGTEAANLGILGAAKANPDTSRKRILFGATEHPCVLETRKPLQALGYQVEMLSPAADGVQEQTEVANRLANDVFLVAVMHANNETGAVNEIASIASDCKQAGALFFGDCVQTFGLLPVSVSEIGADLACFSAHKMYGPKGVGCLFARAGTKPQPIIVGGGQEREMRAGTENVAAIVGFAEAVRLTRSDKNRSDAISSVRDEFVAAVRTSIPTVVITSPRRQLSTHAHLRIPGASAESILINLDRLGVAAGSGSACSSGSIEASHVLVAMGMAEREARECLRFTFGKETTIMEAKEAALLLARASNS
jgi:cysteine desulfurase